MENNNESKIRSNAKKRYHAIVSEHGRDAGGADGHRQGVRHLWPDLPESVLRELDEDPIARAQCIDDVRNWIQDNENFYGRSDDSFILRFLRVAKFDVEKAKQRIQHSYQIRKTFEKWFTRTESNEKMVEELLNRKMFYSTCYAGDPDVTIVFSHSSSCYPKTYSVEAAMGTIMALMSELLIEDPRLQTHGVYFVADWSGIGWDLITQLTPLVCYRLLSLIPVLPIRIRGIVLVNAPWFATKLYYFLKFVLGKKIGSRFFIYKDLSPLHDHISPENLPFEFGGTLGPAQSFIDSSIKLFHDGKPINLENQKYGINKHPQRSVHSDQDT